MQKHFSRFTNALKVATPRSRRLQRIFQVPTLNPAKAWGLVLRRGRRCLGISFLLKLLCYFILFLIFLFEIGNLLRWWHGTSSLAGIKPTFYANNGPNLSSFSYSYKPAKKNYLVHTWGPMEIPFCSAKKKNKKNKMKIIV